VASASETPDDVIGRLRASRRGLTTEEARRRRLRHGPNLVAEQPRNSAVTILMRALLNPLVLLLALLAGSSMVSGDHASAGIMAAMLAIGVGLRFTQEWRADTVAAALREMVRVHATAVRDGQPIEVPIQELVPGDIVHLAAGDMIPADIRLLSCKDLFISQASLTGESFPIEKFAAAEPDGGRSPFELAGVCWLGTSVESGSGEAVVVTTGRNTYLGGMSAALEAPEPPTAFDTGIARFTWLMVGLVALMTPLVFVINGMTKGNWREALFFALAVAVGLTPEMLPMIVAVCLSRGAIGMAGKRVIVKHLDSIQNLGAMDVLCADKTGTLTLDRIILERHCDPMLDENFEVLALAWLNSHFQTGLKNLLDRAILEHEELPGPVASAGWTKIDEIPFDFSRRVMSVVVATPDGRRRLICKGAPEAIYPRCTRYALGGGLHLLERKKLAEFEENFRSLSRQGFRVLAVADRDVGEQASYSRNDEQGLVLQGYVAFLDPPKDSAAEAIRALNAGGVTVKILTGDNELVSRMVCGQVGIATDEILLGGSVDALDDGELAAAIRRATLMARLTPFHKERIVTALRRSGHVVGFIGDGVNDAPALRAADVGISVDSAVDIARASADCILLEKDLRVLEAGVREGRKVFANILKYVRMGASSNFGNMLSVVGASLVLPFVPMTPLQVLFNNLLYDCSQVPIPTDDVDSEQIARPRPWEIHSITRFILLLGPCSSIFDFTTFAVMALVFGCTDAAHADLFRTGWFVESLLTQTLVIHLIRTDRVPFIQSRASLAVCLTTAIVMLVGVWLPTSSLAGVFGFVPLPAGYWPILLATLVGYGTAAHLLNRWLSRRERLLREAGEDANQHDERDGARGGTNQPPDHAAGREPEQVEEEAAEQGSGHADDEVADEPEAAAGHDLAGEPAGGESDEQKPENVHGKSPLRRSSRRMDSRKIDPTR